MYKLATEESIKLIEYPPTERIFQKVRCRRNFLTERKRNKHSSQSYRKKKEKGRKLVFLRLIGKPCRLWGVRDPGKKAKKEFSGRTGQSEDVSQHQRTSALYIGACAMELGLSFVFSPFFPLIFFPLFRSSSYQFFFLLFFRPFLLFLQFLLPFFSLLSRGCCQISFSKEERPRIPERSFHDC